MTSSRVVRGTKSKIFFCVCAVIIVTGIFACYNNTLSQLEDVRKSNNQCHQQQENLSTQLQVIFDYKQRLEKSLKTEKADHQQMKKDVEEERSQHEKTLNEANVKLSSLQQHYNLLQTQYEDFKGENSKIQQEHLDKILTLQGKLKEVQSQLKQAINDKEKEFENLKTNNLDLTIQNKELEQQIRSKSSNDHACESDKNHVQKMYNELRREFESLTAQCSIKHSPVGEFNISKLTNEITGSKPEALGVGDNPSNNMFQPFDSNKNENLNNEEYVIAAPNNVQLPGQIANLQSSSTKSNDKLTSKSGLIAAPPLKLPSVTPSNGKIKPSPESDFLRQNPHVLPLPYAQKRVPAGVVPPPEIVEESKGEQKKAETEEKILPDEINDNAFPNRYRSNLILKEIANENKALQAEQKNEGGNNNNDKPNGLKLDMGEKENNENNAALEVLDAPLNENKPLEMDGGFGLDDHDKISNNEIEKQVNKKHIDALGFNDEKLKNNKNHHKAFDAHHGDYDKILQNDLQLEENDPEEDDDPDYGDNVGRQKDPAVRN